MDVDLFEKITNKIAVLIKNDAEINAFCLANLGSSINATDNAINKGGIFEPILPFFVVTKNEENHNRNRGTADGTRSVFSCSVVFLGEFIAPQTDEAEFTLPDGAVATVNGIATYTPSDIMRKLARISANVIDKEVSCSELPQLMVENFSIFSEGYYDSESGRVGSILELNMYLKNTQSN